ncbi:hypothetical protein GQ457_13G014070 [Hibiscus cannabinus]
MSETCLSQNSSSRGSSTEGYSVRMEGNLPRQAEPQVLVQPQEPAQPPNPEQHPEPVQAPLNPPDVQNVRRERLLSMKEMFDQLVLNLKQDRPVAQNYRGKAEEVEYWLERTTQIVTKQLACSDEHKLECAIALLADEALSWWETTTLTAPPEKITWNFFVEEFKKKYIKKDKSRKFTDGLDDDLCLTFMAMEIDDFQTLVNRVTATEAKMKAADKRKSGHQSDKKQKWDDRSQRSSKNAKYHHARFQLILLLRGVSSLRSLNL